MSRDNAADAQAAYASLFNGKHTTSAKRSTSIPRWYQGTDPWPEAKPDVIAWCPHPRKRCRIGAVYATRWGYLWLHAQPRGGVRAYALLTHPDGSPREAGFAEHVLHGDTDGVADGVGCRHATPREQRIPFKLDELLELIAAVRDGRVRRPANYVAPWNRRAMY